jgi:hypothetical protein
MGLSYQVFDAIGREQCPSIDNDRAKLAKKILRWHVLPAADHAAAQF